MDNKTVLIAEDQGIISLDLKIFLKSNNINSLIVKNGNDLIKQFEITRPDLIIADLNIGGSITGKEALLILNAKSNTPIIIISGLAKAKVEEFADKLSNCSYLLKPFEKSDLLSLIQRLLN